MTKLEESIARHIEDYYEGETNHLKPYYDKLGALAAEVCKGYIDRAVKNLIDRNTTGHQLGEILKKQYQIDYENWLKSEGITE